MSLPAPARRAVRAGAAILRVAESLDRSHGQVVDRVELQLADRGCRLILRSHGPAELERWAASRHLAPLEKVLGTTIAIEVLDEDHAEPVGASSPPRAAPGRRRARR